MRFLRLLPLAAVVFAAGACDEDGKVTNVTRPPLAFIRYVNAVPDTGALDFRFIDAVEYSPNYPNYTFRTIGYYQGAVAGTRPVRVFANSGTIGVTSVPLVDTTITLVAGTYYTILHAGNTRAADGAATADRLIVLDDTRPAQDAGIHVSTVNTSTAAVDVSIAAAVADAWAVTHAAVAYGTRTAYTARASLLGTAVRVAPTTVVVPTATALAFTGAAGTVAQDPVGGSNIAGTQFSAFFFPASVAGSPAPAGFTTPGITFFVDRQPPRTVPD
jgi:hypothetical protein